MLISWGTGFAAPFQQSAPRADATAFRLIAAAVSRARKPLRGKAEIALEVGAVIGAWLR